jgi:hypothetical protein
VSSRTISSEIVGILPLKSRMAGTLPHGPFSDGITARSGGK